MLTMKTAPYLLKYDLYMETRHSNHYYYADRVQIT